VTDLRVISAWLTDLANLTAGNASMREIKPRIGGIASMLSDNFPTGAFTRNSLEHVARQCSFFPSYGELCNALAPWWKDHQPPHRAIAADQPATVKQREIEREVAESWANITPEQIRQKIRNLDGNPMHETLGPWLATALAKYATHHLGQLPPQWLKAHNEQPEIAAEREASLRRAAAFEVRYDTRRGPPDVPRT